MVSAGAGFSLVVLRTEAARAGVTGFSKASVAGVLGHCSSCLSSHGYVSFRLGWMNFKVCSL